MATRTKSHFTDGRSARDWDSLIDDSFSSRRMIRKHLTREQFGERLFNLATDKGWHQAELARQAGITRNAVSNYMRGSYMPDVRSLKKLADAFGMKPEDLLPNVVETEYKMRSDPPLQITTGTDPTTSWVKINRLVKSEGLPEILSVINKWAVTTADD